MTYKVIQWATGGVGRAAIEGVVAHPDLELVGCWVHSADKLSRDAGELAGLAPLGVAATDSQEEILATEADCVIYAPAFPNEDEVIALLESGKHVVSPLGWFYKGRIKHAEKLEAACLKGSAVLHGTGIHPGGFTERLPLQLTALQGSTSYVRSEEFSDIRSYDAPAIVGEMMLFGKTEEEAKASPMGAFLAAGFYQSIQMVADGLQLPLDGMNTVHKVALATMPIAETPIGTIEPGRVAAQRFVWQGLRGGAPVIEAIVNWLMGEEGYDAPWGFGERGQRYEVEVRGDPDLSAVYHGTHPSSVAAGLERNNGIVVTAMHCVNSIPYVCVASPGLCSYLDLPLVAGRAAPLLRG